MFPEFSPTLTMNIAALTLSTLLFIAGASAMDEQVAPPPFGEPSFKGGFSLPIIHRNSPASPLRDPTVTAFNLFKEEIQLASQPVLADALANEKMVVPTHFRRGLYLVPLRIGGSLDPTASLQGTSCLTQAVIYPGRSANLVRIVHGVIFHLIFRPSLAHFIASLVMIHFAST